MSKNLKSTFKQWVARIFKEENKTKRFVSDVASKITSCQLKESKTHLEDIIAQDLSNKIQEIKLRNGDSNEAYKVIQNFLKDNQLEVSSKNKSFINQSLLNYLNKQTEQQLNLQDLLPNVYNPISHTYDCICPKATKDLQVPQRTQTCYRCKRECHTNCLWGPQAKDEQYECPMCFGCFCLPNRRVEQVLFGGYLRQTKKDKIEYKINLPLQFQLHQDQALQVRCMRLGKDSKYELTWPENCLVYLNNRKLIELRPLPASSSLKRRVDEEIVLEKKLLSNSNILTIQQKRQYIEGSRNVNNQHHFVIVVLVRNLPSNVVEQEFMKSRLTVEQSKQKLKQHIQSISFQDCVIEKIKVSLHCQFYAKRIDIPVRSRCCQWHSQSFDLKNFILANINSKNSSQKWKCPLCKKRAYDLQVDDYLLSLITENPGIQEILFNRQAQPQLEQPNNIHELVQSQSIQINGLEIYKSEHKNLFIQSSFIKKQSRNLPNQNEAICLDEHEPISGQIYRQCIQLQDTPQENDNNKRETSQYKRTYNSRVKSRTISQKKDCTKKKNKQDVQPKLLVEKTTSQKQYSSVQQLESIQSQSEMQDYESEYSENQEQEFKPNSKKSQKKASHQRQRVWIEKQQKQVPKSFKTLAPSPSIRTVIPEAIRINEVRLPEPKKTVAVQQPIEIIDEQQQSFETIQQRKLQYQKSELQKYRLSISNKQNYVISPQEQSTFLSLCQKFLLSMARG